MRLLLLLIILLVNVLFDCWNHHHVLAFSLLTTTPTTYRQSQSLGTFRSFSASRLFASTTDDNKQDKKEDRPRRRRPLSGRKPSTVHDPDGPTPDLEQVPVEEVDPTKDIPELRDIRDASELPHPIPHQPWRRGDTAGCEAPIAAEWRRKAEDIITKAVEVVGGQALDVTWYLTAVVVTLDDDVRPLQDLTKSAGPVIDVKPRQDPMYYDPSDPNPKDIWDDQDEVLYQRETEEEAEERKQRRKNMWAKKDPDDPPDEPHIQDYTPGDDIPLYMNEETRAHIAGLVAAEEYERSLEEGKPMYRGELQVDTAALSTIAKAILDALEDYEDELQILSRHELILTSPAPPGLLDTQRQFDAYRGSDVIVETQDPFNSNRTLKGKLVDRNAMDVIINKKGRMVTIPLNFVAGVRLAEEEIEEVEVKEKS